MHMFAKTMKTKNAIMPDVGQNGFVKSTMIIWHTAYILDKISLLFVQPLISRPNNEQQ